MMNGRDLTRKKELFNLLVLWWFLSDSNCNKSNTTSDISMLEPEPHSESKYYTMIFQNVLEETLLLGLVSYQHLQP